MEQAATILLYAVAIAVGGPIVLAAIIGICAFLFVIIDDITSRIPSKKRK